MSARILSGKSVAEAVKGVDVTGIKAHRRTPNLTDLYRSADRLITGASRQRMFDASYVKPGAIVIDGGTNRTDDGLVGDVAFDEVFKIAWVITPMPGGVGPMVRASRPTNSVALATAAVF